MRVGVGWSERRRRKGERGIDNEARRNESISFKSLTFYRKALGCSGLP
jgi:hypothetical protein